MVKFTGKIEKITDEIDGVKTFRIQSPCAFEFVPGQFMMLSFEKDGVKYGPNAFSISSCPQDDSDESYDSCYVDFTIKKRENFTSTFFTLEKHDFVECNGPFGNMINFDSSIKDDVAFVAIGTAIAPFMSSLEYAVKNNMSQKFTLIYGSRTREDMIFRNRLTKLVEEHDNISIYNFLSREECELTGDDYAGRIPLDEITTLVDNPNETQWFICGSSEFNTSSVSALESKGISKDHIHVESWGKSASKK